MTPTPADGPPIQVIGIDRYFGPIHAVKDLSFELRAGEVLGFLGPNGAGKSTTMKILCGALAPSAGQVLIAGVDLFTAPREAKRRLGYLPEEPPLYRDLTVDEYLCFCARIRGLDNIGPAVGEVKVRCGLDDVGHRLIDNLSKGFAQRVGIAQAIIHRPDVVVLDEPTTGLDPIQIREIRMLIRELGGEHSVILSTHILPEANSVCDRVLILHHGELVLDANTASVAKPSGTVALGLRQGPDSAELHRAAGALWNGGAKLHEVVQTDVDRYRLVFDGPVPPLEPLSRLAVSQDWGLFELRPGTESLEDLFIALTCSEPPASPPGAPEPTESA